MIYTEYTRRAIRIAYRAHRTQTDKSGLPYIHHPLHIAEQMPDESSTIAALLHDTVEDTDVTLEELQAAGFPPDALEAVQSLTHDPSVPYLDYIRALRNHPIAVRVKLADLAHNSDLSRLDTVTENDLRRVEKYRQAMNILRVTEVVAALIWDGGRFLACQRPADKTRGTMWEFVGGKVEPGETREEALARECLEELGIAVSVGEIFTEVTHYYPDLTVHLTLFHCMITAGEPQKLEHADIRWLTPAEAENFPFCPADISFLKKMKEQYG